MRSIRNVLLAAGLLSSSFAFADAKIKTFVDIHRNVPKNMTDAQLAADHKKDLDVEKKHKNVHYTHAFYDKDQGVIMCTCKAPTKEECDAVHKEAHDGHGADEIFEVTEH
jgi:Protein of unknown function (DUF4242)